MNRKYKVLDKSEQKALKKMFPKLIQVIKGDEGIEPFYHHLMISVFDHVLDENEAQHLISSSEGSNSHFKAWFNSLCMFAKNLYLETPLLNVRTLGINNRKNVSARKQKVSFRQYTSFDNFEKIINDPNNYFFGTIVLPEFKMIYIPGFDFTHHIFYKDKSFLPHIEKIAQKSGVYIL